jgi:23S rRNA (guanine2445-N2)-methyltransferase / 23S rRNA (guanine2069-N7)-methyltransferase
VDPARTLAVDVAGKNSPAGPGHFLALKAKDAVVDRVRDAEGRRPDVDTADPDLRIHLHVRGARVTVAIDLAGRGLHRRGIGRAGGDAPLKENLAAAILRIAGWQHRHGELPLFDPMCGSATLLLEAAWIALDVAPGLTRGRIGAEGWRGHDGPSWMRLCIDAAERRRSAAARRPRIFGCDASERTLAGAAENLRRAGLEQVVRLERRELREAEPPVEGAGLVVTNPPYGARLGEAGELGPLYELLGDRLKQRFPGWTAWVLCGSPALAKRIGLRPSSRHVLYNGPLETRLVEVAISTAAAGDGPGWRKPGDEATGFRTRLRRNLKRLGGAARREGLGCYRVYDADLPAYNLAVDWYDGKVRVEEYARPKRVRESDADRRLRDALLVVAEVLEVDRADVSLRVRARRAPGEQHRSRGDAGRLHPVREGSLRFLVNLDDYLDTGLFLDDRLLRRRLLESSRDRDVLDLFAYTCTASAAAAVGGARSTTSVDLSQRYLAWGRQNFALNGVELAGHRFERADALRWIDDPRRRGRYDLVFLAPPTHSTSRRMQSDFDVQRDHADLLARTARLLTPGGEILFSTNLRGFELVDPPPAPLAAREISAEITPFDFATRPRLRAWSIRRKGSGAARGGRKRPGRRA